VEISDEALCERVARQDAAAFDVLVERYQQRAYRLAWSIVRDAEEARDISQEAFIRLYQVAGSFEGRAKFSTWFYRILVNLCLDHQRRHRWWHHVLGRADGDDRAAALDRVAAPDPPAVDAVLKNEAIGQLWVAVDRLSPQQRAAVLLQLDGLPTSEIAAVLKCSEPTVRVHLHRALMSLKKIMRVG
jgi:RNA polymerase sigma-70 factor (ECF subfamily)